MDGSREPAAANICRKLRMKKERSDQRQKVIK